MKKLLVIGVILVLSSVSVSVASRSISNVVSKEEYKGASVFPSVDDTLTYDFWLMQLPSSDLSCWGNLTWENVYPGEIVKAKIWVRNNGGSDLLWKVSDWPSWGTWEFESYFPVLPPGGTYIVFVNVTAPPQANTTFTGQVTLVNTENTSDYGVINASLTTQGFRWYAVSERLIGLIRNLQTSENTTSFQMIIGGGIRIIDYDDGGMVALVVPYFFTPVLWSQNAVFEGILRPHFIKGRVQYRVNYTMV
jgi:hypothetical protein